jgi:hypothetical protein
MLEEIRVAAEESGLFRGHTPITGMHCRVTGESPTLRFSAIFSTGKEMGVSFENGGTRAREPMEPPVGYGLKHRSIFRSPAYEGATGFSRTRGNEIGLGSSPDASRLINVAVVITDSVASRIRSRRREWRSLECHYKRESKYTSGRYLETAADRDAILLFIR